jgi:threonine dehydrogenase-like Zn-dependent dehydrogenase
MGDIVVVLGCGAIGSIGIAMARAAGAGMILACDRVPHRVELAKAMGADVAVNTAEEDFLDAVMTWTKGRGADVVFDAAGDPATINLGFRCARAGARFVLIGIPVPLEFNVDLHTAMDKELNIQVMKRSNHKGRAAAELIASGAIPTSLITHALPLAKAQEGFEMAHDYRDGVGKLLFDFDL